MMKLTSPFVGIITACWAMAASHESIKRVAGHTFAIPRDYLFEERVPWLTFPAQNSFVFLLAPAFDADQIPEHRVLIESLDERCSGALSELMRAACSGEPEPEPALTTSVIEKHANPELGDWASNLFIVQRDASHTIVRRRQIAYCQMFDPNPVNPTSVNQCTVVWGHRGMLLQFSFDEREVGELAKMKAQAMRLLNAWDVSER